LSPEPGFAADTSAASEAELQVDSGFTSSVFGGGHRLTTAGAVITNPRRTAACKVIVSFTLFDANGRALDEQPGYVGWIPAKASAIVAPTLELGSLRENIEVDPSSLTVKPFVDHWTKTKNASGCSASSNFRNWRPMEVSDVAIQRGESEIETEIVGQVTNPTSKRVNHFFVACVTRTGSTIVGGARDMIRDPIPARGTIEFRVSTILAFVPANADSAECQVTS
jgi:hypothetical protein